MESRELTIKDVLFSLLGKYTKELNEAVGGQLRLFVQTIMEKISLGDPIIPLTDDELDFIKKLMDAHGYDNITYWNFVKN